MRTATRVAVVAFLVGATLAACGGDSSTEGSGSKESSSETPGVCAPTATLELASEVNGLTARQMPLVSAVFWNTEDTYTNLAIGDFEQSEPNPFLERPPGYLQLNFLLDHGGPLETGPQDTITDIFRDGGASAPTIRAERGDDITVTVIEPNRLCGEIDIDDGATIISGAFEARRIPAPPQR